jgi:8-oxo-dGTP pyrophosphatase MutT (NUDIX family)
VTLTRDFITARLDPLGAALPVGHSDYDLNPTARPLVPVDRRPAAVLVAIVEHPEGMTVLLTKRAETLRQHTGQVAFPGGRSEAGETPVETALREAHEEIGLDASFIEPVGLLTPYETVTRYDVTPVVAFVRPGFTLSVSAAEVAAVFEPPLAWLMDAANHHRQFREPMGGGPKRHFYAMPFGDYYIWGATAGMLRGLYERLYGEAAMQPSEAAS